MRRTTLHRRVRARRPTSALSDLRAKSRATSVRTSPVNLYETILSFSHERIFRAMASPLVPFLYHTRTIQSSLRTTALLATRRTFHASTGGWRARQDQSIPFDWGHGRQHDDANDASDTGVHDSTITPSEAHIFKGIFDEIAQGKLSDEKRRSSRASQFSVGGNQDTISPSIGEQDRVKDFRDKFLQRYPKSLRNAAQVALGLYEPEAGNSDGSAAHQLEEADAQIWAEKARYDRMRTEERKRVCDIMDSCETDVALWGVMEQEVFSLPKRLGIEQEKKKTRYKIKDQDTPEKLHQAQIDGDSDGSGDGGARAMDIHGPLYSHYISHGLHLFETAFSRPSPFVFRLLPRMKDLGLSSYVLGVSTPFYSRLARLHWTRYGDANSALDVLHEMISAGLYANRDVKDLLATIRNHLHGCTWGSQGEFVMAMMELPPYDAALGEKLEDMERYAAKSIMEREQEYGV